jgi:lipid-binding SYLF domain-containing protein
MSLSAAEYQAMETGLTSIFISANCYDWRFPVNSRDNRNLFIKVVLPAGLAIFTCFLMPSFVRAADNNTEEERIKTSGDVLKELLNGPNGIPLNLLNKSECVIVLPSVKKAGFLIAGQYGRGIMTCRSGQNFDGSWSAPIMMRSSGGSFGLQAGGQATDFVILVMNDKGARAVLHGKAKLGADASVAAGPVGRDAEASTNAGMSAQMLSYSRAQGVFGGVSLSGTSLAPDSGANEKIYGKKVSGEQIFSGSVQAPASAAELLSTLQDKSPSNGSRGKS